MSNRIHPNIDFIGDVALGLATLAIELAKASRRLMPATPRPRRGGTIRPGTDTPLWNALAASVRPHLKRYGTKINLGRMLGVPPQRVYEYFNSRSAAPDAERTLQLVVWLAQGAPRLAGPARKVREPRSRDIPDKRGSARTSRIK